jgi:hypothetical protein
MFTEHCKRCPCMNIVYTMGVDSALQLIASWTTIPGSLFVHYCFKADLSTQG